MASKAYTTVRRKRTDVGELAVLPYQEVVLGRERAKLVDKILVKVLDDVNVRLQVYKGRCSAVR